MVQSCDSHEKHIRACPAGVGVREADGGGIFAGDRRFSARRLSNPGLPRVRARRFEHHWKTIRNLRTRCFLFRKIERVENRIAGRKRATCLWQGTQVRSAFASLEGWNRA